MTEPAEPEHVETSQPSAARRGGQWVGRMLFATLLMLACLGAAGYWFGWPWAEQTWQRFEAMESKLGSIEQKETATPPAEIARIASASADREIRNALATLESEWQRALAESSARQNAERAESARQISNRMKRIEDQVDRLLAVDRRAWLGQEAIFLTRLAGQRLLVARDVDAALSLLGQADELLRDTGEPRFESARLAIARDRAALTAVPSVDQVGLYARLSAIIDQVDQLQLEFGKHETKDTPGPTPERSWWDQASAGWRAALAALSNHLIIRRRSDEIAQLMTPEWAALARQNARMLLEQAQIAMLSANQALFEQSLGRATEFVTLFVEQDPERVTSLVEGIESLRGEDVAPALPNLTDTRSLLESQVERLGAEAPR